LPPIPHVHPTPCSQASLESDLGDLRKAKAVHLQQLQDQQPEEFKAMEEKEGDCYEEVKGEMK
jgi:hypothetical protein